MVRYVMRFVDNIVVNDFFVEDFVTILLLIKKRFVYGN